MYIGRGNGNLGLEAHRDVQFIYGAAQQFFRRWMPTIRYLSITPPRKKHEIEPYNNLCASGLVVVLESWNRNQCPRTGQYRTLLTSSSACAIPLFSGRSKKNSRRKQILFYCQHFGTGVLLATAFVHLLPTAFASLTDPCLPYVFSKGYKPFAGFIAMVFALAVVGLESYLHTRGAGHSHSHTLWENDSESSETTLRMKPASLAARREHNYRPRNIAIEDADASQGLIAGVSPLPGSTPTMQQPEDKAAASLRGAFNNSEEDDVDDDALPLTLDELDPLPIHDGSGYGRVSNGVSVAKGVQIEPEAPQPT